MPQCNAQGVWSVKQLISRHPKSSVQCQTAVGLVVQVILKSLNKLTVSYELALFSVCEIFFSITRKSKRFEFQMKHLHVCAYLFLCVNGNWTDLSKSRNDKRPKKYVSMITFWKITKFGGLTRMFYMYRRIHYK